MLIFHLPIFLYYLLAFCNLITKMQSVTNNSLSANTLQKFRSEFIKCVPWYSGNLWVTYSQSFFRDIILTISKIYWSLVSSPRQQDALEFFTYLLDALHEEIKECVQSSDVDSPTTPTHNQLSTSAVLPEKNKNHRSRRVGGLKTSESSCQLPSVEGSATEVSDSKDNRKQPLRKWSHRPLKSRTASSHQVNIYKPAM